MSNIIKIENYLNGLGTNLFDKIPKEVLQFWSEHYGKDVCINIIDCNGKSWTVDKVLTVDDYSDSIHEKKSCRNNSSPEELDYSLQYLESILPNWEEQSELIPIFGINSKDNSEYDLLVLNMIDKPKACIWVHEENFDEPLLIDIKNEITDFFKNITI